MAIPFFLWWLFCLAALLAAFWAGKNNVRFSFIFLLLCFGLGALHTRNYFYLSYNHIGRLNLQKSKPVQVCGIVASDPAIGRRKVSFSLGLKKIAIREKVYEAEGRLLVNVFKAEQLGSRRLQPALSYGDELRLEGNLYRPFNFGGQVFSYRDYLRYQGIAYILNLRKEDSVTVLGRKGSRINALAFRLKHKLKGVFNKYLWPENSRILEGIILGERQNFPPAIRQAFIQTGTSHIIAISGFNVGIVAFIALILLKALAIKRKVRYGITIPLLILHMCAVGAGASVVRATIMAVIVLFAYVIEREPHIINNLSLAALVILGYNPLQIFDVGFQLSFVSVLGILLLSPKIIRLLPSQGLAFLTRLSLVRSLIISFSVSFAAWIATSGFIAYYFRIVSPITLLANLIIVPATSLIIILGFTLGVSAMFFPMLAPSVAATTNCALGLLVKITSYLSRLPGAYFYLPP